MWRSPEDDARVAATTEAARAASKKNMDAFAALVRGRINLKYVGDAMRETSARETRIIAHIRGGTVGIRVGDQIKKVPKIATIIEVPDEGLVFRAGKVGEQAEYSLSMGDLRRAAPNLEEAVGKALEAHRGRLRRGT